jgi:glutathione S-transferase
MTGTLQRHTGFTAEGTDQTSAEMSKWNRLSLSEIESPFGRAINTLLSDGLAFRFYHIPEEQIEALRHEAIDALGDWFERRLAQMVRYSQTKQMMAPRLPAVKRDRRGVLVFQAGGPR